MPTVYDNIKNSIAQRPWLKAALGALFALLSFGKSKDLFNETEGPKIGPK